jgi:hypothetical protein
MSSPLKVATSKTVAKLLSEYKGTPVKDSSKALKNYKRI